MEKWNPGAVFLKKCCNCHFSERKPAFPLFENKIKLQNWFNPFVIQTWRVRVTSALSPEICCYVCTKWVLFIVPCHSLRAWHFYLKLCSGRTVSTFQVHWIFEKKSCSTSEREGIEARRAVQAQSLPWPWISPRLPQAESPHSCSACWEAGRFKINTCLCARSTSLSTWLQKLE